MVGVDHETYNQWRIKIEYNGEYDDDWRINLMKTRIRVPVLVRNKLTAIVKDLINELRKMNYKKTKGLKAPSLQ